MSTVVDFPLNSLHPELRSHVVNVKLCRIIGRRNFEMLMEMYTAHLDDKFDEWFDSHSNHHINSCLELSKFAVTYASKMASKMNAG